jgi:hypothetical protein
MKAILIFFLSMFMLLSSTEAQLYVCQMGAGGSAYNQAMDMQPDSRAYNEMLMVMRAMCGNNCGNVTLVQNRTASLAMMFVLSQGVSKIVYNPDDFNYISTRYGGAATIAIFAHELGHHIDFYYVPPSWMQSSWDREIKADAWAGYALAKLGLSTTETEIFLKVLAAYPSPTHPAWNIRIPALRSGFYAGGGTNWRW